MALFKPSVKKLEEEGDIAGLIKALTEDAHSARHDDALHALGRIGEPAAAPLIQALSVLPGRKYAIAGALGEIGKSAVEALIRVLPSQNPAVRYGAAMALGRLKDATAMHALIHALRLEHNHEAGYQEAYAILSLGPVAVKPFVNELTQMMKRFRSQARHWWEN
jgi:HEAT repeat protein